MHPLNDLFMIKVEELESERRKFSQAGLRLIRDHLQTS